MNRLLRLWTENGAFLGHEPLSRTFNGADCPVVQIGIDVVDSWNMRYFPKNEIDVGNLVIRFRRFNKRAGKIDNSVCAGNCNKFQIGPMSGQDVANQMVHLVARGNVPTSVLHICLSP